MCLKLNNSELNKIANQIGFDVPISLEKKNTLLIGKKTSTYSNAVGNLGSDHIVFMWL